MKLSVKDPGSALTHFIAMILAVLAAAPPRFSPTGSTWRPWLYLSSV